METNNLQEYAQIREEMRHIEDCITDYMKTFYATGAAAAVIVWYLTRSIVERREILIGIPGANQNTVDDLILKPQTVGYVTLLLSIILLSFSHIVFHKLNTRNRYTGYLRALSYERWNKPPNANPTIILWEICLHFLYNDLAKTIIADFPDNSTRNVATQFYEEIDHRFDTRLVRWYVNIGRFVFRSVLGIWMTVRTAVRRYDTKSWTFPYVILFGLLGSGGMLIAMWFLIIRDLDRVSFIVQLPIVVFVLFGWLGMCNRLYRLCAEDGDRTIDAYMYKFLVCREAALYAYKISYEWTYLPIAPKIDKSSGTWRLRVRY